MIHHPIEAPLGLGSRVEGGFWVSRVWGERKHERERESERELGRRERVRVSESGESVV